MTNIDSGFALDPSRITGLFTDGVSGISDALVSLAVAASVAAIVITVIRGYLSAGNEKVSVALGRILRIVLIVSLIAFFAWGLSHIAIVMGWQGI